MPQLMLLEDDETMVQLLKTLLQMEGFQVSTLANPTPESLPDAVRSQHPDVLLIDVHLRKVSGLDLLKRLRQDPQLGNLKIIMTSGMDLRSQCMKFGADGFLMKPFMPEELMQQINGSHRGAVQD